jgi:hypothetical protein
LEPRVSQSGFWKRYFHFCRSNSEIQIPLRCAQTFEKGYFLERQSLFKIINAINAVNAGDAVNHVGYLDDILHLADLFPEFVNDRMFHQKYECGDSQVTANIGTIFGQFVATQILECIPLRIQTTSDL